MGDRTAGDSNDKPENLERSGDAARNEIVHLAFAGDRAWYDEFVRAIREAIPPDVSVVLRGSAVTGTRWEDHAPFDADGPNTSDLDLTLVGGGMTNLFDVFYIPGLHTAPLSDAHPDASVALMPLRSALCAIARRPVNIQATADFIQFARDVAMRQPYFTMIERDAG